MPSMVVLYSRHFCRTCKQRVFPYDGIERQTEAPARGASDSRILLFSENAKRARKNPDDPRRVAYCWNCMDWTETFRETLDDIIKRYTRRAGVRYRVRPTIVVRAVKKRRSGKILQMPKRKSA